MPRGADDEPDELTASERARLRARDRKRTTTMVVDSAGIKRTALALAQRRSNRAPTPPPADGGPAGGEARAGGPGVPGRP